MRVKRGLFAIVLLFGMIAGVCAAANVTLQDLNSTYSCVNITNALNLYGYEVAFDYAGANGTISASQENFLGSSDTTYGTNLRSSIFYVYGSRLDNTQQGVSGNGSVFNLTHAGGNATLRYLLTIKNDSSEEYVYYNATAASTHLACVDEACVSVSGAGTDSCTTDEDCAEEPPDSCFPAGTLVRMADGSNKKIEDVKAGDYIYSLNVATNEKDIAKVLETSSPMAEGYYEVSGIINVTDDHPLYAKKSDGRIGWAAINKNKAQNYLNSYSSIRWDILDLEAGDYLKGFDGGWKEIEYIEYHPGKLRTYNLRDVDKTSTFYVNDVLAHNKECFLPGTLITMADGSEKKIEDLRIGDRVASYDYWNGKHMNAKILELESPLAEGYYTINEMLNTTKLHPFYVKKSDGRIGWAAIDEKASEIQVMGHSLGGADIMPLEIGDSMLDINDNWIEIDSIKEHPGLIRTYNIRTLDKYYTFYANGLLAHNKDGPPNETIVFNVTPKNINLNVIAGEAANQVIEIVNNGTGTVVLRINVSGVDDIATANESRIAVNPGKRYYISLDVLSSTTGIRTGLITFIYNPTNKKEIPITINTRTKNFKVDAALSIPQQYKSIIIGKTIKPVVTLNQVGDIYETEVSIRYVIKNFQDTTVLSKNISVRFSGSRSVEQELDTSALPAGKYTLGVIVDYGTGQVPASDQFTLKKKLLSINPRLWTVLFVVLISVVVAVGILFGIRFAITRAHHYVKTQKKVKEEKKESETPGAVTKRTDKGLVISLIGKTE